MSWCLLGKMKFRTLDWLVPGLCPGYIWRFVIATSVTLEETENSVLQRRKTDGGQMVIWGLLVLLTWGILGRQLSVEWTANEQYQYGWFVPVFAVYLLWLRWVDRPSASPESRHFWGWIWLVGMGFALMLPIRLFEVANPDWRLLSWVHALLMVALTWLAIWALGGKSWWRHFAFPVCFFLVAVPWVTPIETPIIQGLQRIVAAIVTEMMGMLGIPAQLEGSVIRLRTGVVGVNEACSGVRSLQTSIMSGLLFGELNRLAWPRRVGLVILLIGVALAANIFRGAYLVWVAAHRGVDAVAGVHDMAGNIVLGIVVVGSFALAGLLTPRKKEVATGAEIEAKRSGILQGVKAVSVKPLIAVLCWLVAVEIGVEAWYRWHERGLVSQSRWEVNWPETEIGYREVEIDEQTRLTLRYDTGGAAAWQGKKSTSAENAARRSTVRSSEEGWLLYFFRWEPGRSSALRAKAHRPDVCFPNTGWKQTADRGVKFFEAIPGMQLPFRHFEFFHPGGGSGNKTFAQAFFCLQEDKIARDSVKPGLGNAEVAGDVGDWGWRNRIKTVQTGRRDLGQQVMEVVITSSEELTGENAEKAFAAKLREMVKSGG